MDSSLIFSGIIALGIVVLGLGLAQKDSSVDNKRIQYVSKDKEGALKRKQADPDADRRKKLLGNIKDLEIKERQMRKARLSTEAKIEQAGMTITPLNFWMFSIGIGVFVALVLFVIGQPFYIALGAAFAAGFGFPQWVLKFMIGMRQKKFILEFATSIEVIVRGVKSGLPLNECLKMIGREAIEPLGGEFRRLVDQTSMGVPLDQALAKLFERMPLPEVSFFAIVLSIQQKAGGNLSEALQNLATVLRSRKMMREKINALSSEAKASA
ncbi:MAG: type II secretion system F family protein, partial [Pseudomonadota bacterium]